MQTHIDVNVEPVDIEDDHEPVRRPVGRANVKKPTSTSRIINSDNSLFNIFEDKFDNYVKLQSYKVGIMNQVGHKIVETQQRLQRNTGVEIMKSEMENMKMKPEETKGKDLLILITMKEKVVQNIEI